MKTDKLNALVLAHFAQAVLEGLFESVRYLESHDGFVTTLTRNQAGDDFEFAVVSAGTENIKLARNSGLSSADSPFRRDSGF